MPTHATSSGRSRRRSSEKAEEVESPEETKPGESESASGSEDDIDAILAEIDDVLEENAEEFVRGFVQKGGQ